VKILIITDNDWVKESVEKYIDFESSITSTTEFHEVDEYYEYIFVDMQVKNNGGPSIIRELKRNKFCKNSSIILLADREADEFQAKRVNADFFIVKPIESNSITKVFKK
jgi:DNA-binding response OmpR family regulator